jgi:hypothetical protein
VIIFGKLKYKGMKKLVTLLFLTGTLWACNNKGPSEKKEIINPGEADHHEQSVSSGELVLNNGAKWKADSTTNNNVRHLQTVLEQFNGRTDKSLTIYKKTAADLQQGLDKMISECKMQGPDHEALHKWLEPLIEQVTKLKKASTEADAAQSLEAIQAHVKLYSQFFE